MQDAGSQSVLESFPESNDAPHVERPGVMDVSSHGCSSQGFPHA